MFTTIIVRHTSAIKWLQNVSEHENVVKITASPPPEGSLNGSSAPMRFVLTRGLYSLSVQELKVSNHVIGQGQIICFCGSIFF